MMKIVDIWDYCLTYIKRGPDRINVWYDTVYKALNSYSGKVRMNDTCRELIDLIIFYNNFDNFFDKNLYEIFNLLNAISKIAIIENANKYAMILLLSSDNMVEFSKNLPDSIRYNVEADLVFSICNTSFALDYVEYTVHHIFKNAPFLESVASNSYDKYFINSLKDKIQSDDSEIRNSCYQNIDIIVNSLWDLCNNRDARIYMMKNMYTELYGKNSDLYDSDIEKLSKKYSLLLPDDHNFDIISIDVIYFITTNPYRYDYEVSIYLSNEFEYELIFERDETMRILKCYIEDVVSIMFDRGLIEDKSISSSLYLSINKYLDDILSKENELGIEDDIDDTLDIILESSFSTRTKLAHNYHKAESAITKGYNTYKRNEMQVDNQLGKIISAAKKGFIGDTRTEIIEGKEFSPITLLKRVLRTAAVFHFSKIGGLLYILVGKVMKGKAYVTERKKMLLELEEEIEIIAEKIEDAKSDNNRKAKYNLMRTKKELENARDRIKFGITADKKSDITAGGLLAKNAERNRTISAGA